jgi:hypothetical protein
VFEAHSLEADKKALALQARSEQKMDLDAVNLDKYRANAQRYLDGNGEKIPLAIMLSGSLNPVHRMHIFNFELAKQFLEEKGFAV